MPDPVDEGDGAGLLAADVTVAVDRTAPAGKSRLALEVAYSLARARVLMADAPTRNESLHRYMEERQRTLSALNLGRNTAGREGVLVDTFNTPAVVIGRGNVRGSLQPEQAGRPPPAC